MPFNERFSLANFWHVVFDILVLFCSFLLLALWAVTQHMLKNKCPKSTGWVWIFLTFDWLRLSTIGHKISLDTCPKGSFPGKVLLYVRYIYRYVPPQRSWFLRRFDLENWYRLFTFWSGIGYGCRGNYESLWTYLSSQFQMIKKER